MKKRELSDLCGRIDTELAWRKKEIMSMQMTARSTESGLTQATIIRSGLPLIYAHWEGFVKAAIKLYFKYLEAQSESANRLSSRIIALAYKNKLNAAAEAKSSQHFAALIDEIRMDSEIKCIEPSTAVNPEANLSYEVLTKIYNSLGLDIYKFTTKDKFINQTLLKNRNTIAHGEFLLIDMVEYIKTGATVIEMIEWVATDIIGHATEKQYLHSP